MKISINQEDWKHNNEVEIEFLENKLGTQNLGTGKKNNDGESRKITAGLRTKHMMSFLKYIKIFKQFNKIYKHSTS